MDKTWNFSALAERLREAYSEEEMERDVIFNPVLGAPYGAIPQPDGNSEDLGENE